MDGAEAYNWVKYIYIDDPISSLDENNAIAVASHLAQLLKKQDQYQNGHLITSHALLQCDCATNLIKQIKYFLEQKSTRK